VDEKGFPDLFFCEPRGEHHGLAIELKRDKGRATIRCRTLRASYEVLAASEVHLAVVSTSMAWF
jgi:hypothetical protein